MNTEEAKKIAEAIVLCVAAAYGKGQTVGELKQKCVEILTTEPAAPVEKEYRAGEWVRQQLDNVLEVRSSGYVLKRLWDGDEADMALFDRGRIFPDTPEGREAAEWFAFCEGFRARWRRSADVAPNITGCLPWLTSYGHLQISGHFSVYGLPKWSTTEACRAFIDSEGGPEKFAEILKRGIL